MKTLNELLAIVAIVLTIAAGVMTGLFGYKKLNSTTRRRFSSAKKVDASVPNAGVTA